MDDAAQQRINAFIKKWENSGGNERANYQGFFLDLCEALGVPSPPPKGNVADDPYCFEKGIKIYHPSGKVTDGRIDFYKADHFIIEAKQGSDQTGKGTAKRGTPSYLKAMEEAFRQAIAYARNAPTRPPFLLTCDIGDHFELWTGFNGDYGGYAARRDIELSALRQEKIFDEFVDIFTAPQARNPEKIAAKVTREVAADLAELTKSLERSPANSPSPLTPRPMGEGNRSEPSSPAGKRAGDEGYGGDEGEWDGEFSRLAGRWRQIPDEYIEKARELRRNQTPTEKLLWELLRAKRFLGAKFRRQHKIGQFIADFYCHEARLVIELDGAVHDQQSRQDRDRDQWMRANSITVLRFRNAEVADNTEAVLSAIAEVISPSPPTPLPKDEGNRSEPPSPAGRRAGDEGQTGDEGYNHAQAVAHFLMRCIFTMFAEDVGLLKEHLFTNALKTRWLENPKSFKPEIEALWQAMNEGGSFGFHGQLLRFNGGLFADPVAFDLSADQIQILLDAAERDWKNVEPAIFGTLLERALDAKERSKLGAHYTPRSYVERLVKPVVMEPLQSQWVLVQGDAKKHLGNDPTPAKKKKAIATLETFLTELRQTRILDPACGTGNFLYVTLDLIKQLESEVLKRLEDITGQAQLRLDIDQVNPSQFLGIEINPRAAAIADLVIWIGYLQWHFRRFGDLPPVEPVLREYNNIECRDAVLAYDGKEEDVDPATGQVRSRWGGRKMIHPVTGEEVPDPSDQIPIYRYLNARPAEWPEADYVVSNPPFIGNKRMRDALGDGYTESLRNTYNEIPESADYVMYWWYFSANLTREESIKRFGLITTNSISQSFNSRLVEKVRKAGISITFAIPDHPWVDNADGAAVRVAMTLAEKGKARPGYLLNLKEDIEEVNEDSERLSFDKNFGLINASLNLGVSAESLTKLKSNEGIVFQGVIPIGNGFKLQESELQRFGYSPSNHPEIIKPYVIGMDIVRVPKKKWIIDLFGLDESQVAESFPQVYQHIYETVRPVRLQNREPSRRKNWWLFARSNEELRAAIKPLNHFIAIPDTSKFKPFTLIDARTLPDAQVYCIASDDPWILCVLESVVHQTWLQQIAPRMGKGNDLRWKPAVVFNLFPFPDPTPEQKQKIRDLGERLDAHRKKVQAAHPDITITGMYNLLEKLRAGEPFTDKDRDYNDRALVSTLKQIHDELDVAVLEAYGWGDLVPLLSPSPSGRGARGEGFNAPSPSSPTLLPPGEGSRSPSPGGRGARGEGLDDLILERLVALNAERAEEERNGHIRWLRPEYQAPDQSPLSSGRGAGGEGSGGEGQQQALPGITEPEETVIAPVEQQKFPTSFKDQLAAIRDLLRTQGGEWTVAQVKAQFKNASRKQKAIQDCLDTLTELGVIAVHTEDGPPRWYIADLQKAA